MALGTNIKKLIEIQNSLIGDFEVVKPGRLLVRSGILKKLCRKEMQSRMFFLFSDTLVCTTPLTSGYRFKTNLSLDGMKVSKPSKEDFANEFSIISTIRSFRLSASTSEERDEWLKTLQNTISDYRQKKFSYLLQTNKCHRNTTGCDALFQNDVDFKLGKQAPVWVPDSRVSMCAKCHEEFTVTFRRHHCRACGKVFCGVCSDNRAPLCYQNYKPGRVCIDCFNYLKAEASILVRNVQHTEHTRQMMDSMKVFFQTFSHGSSHGRDSMWSSFGKGKRKRSSLLQEVKAATEDADTSGYMEIWENKRWKKMWFVLKNKVLYFYRASEDTAAVKSIVLIGFEVQTFGEPFQKVDPSLIFQVIHKNVQPLTFKTENESSRDRWLKYMKQAVIP
ncbi:hypothetical protein LSH36_601g01011 [Paralvinella palmiformis]|uniref:Uncharacterized protein n=1 Tax=Paralvinella palmiformis TaxID=53620 RepID=A0AAD9J5K4_9ANNE|nr:hypothetical protein LSH36_601g01011 [Paralvinella palmiformis]